MSGFWGNKLYLYFFIVLFSMVLGRFALEFTTIVGALAAIVLILMRKKNYLFEMKENRYLYVSLAFLIPIGIAWIDSLNPSMTASVFGRMVRYFFMGVLAIIMAAYDENRGKLEVLSFAMIMFVAMDAISQWLFGFHIHGHNPVVGNRVMGVFFDKAHLSYFLGTLAPVVFFFLYQKLEERMTPLRLLLAVLALLLLVVSVFIGGARAGMISLAVSLGLFVIYLFAKGKVKHKARFIGGAIVILLAFGAIVSQLDIVQERFFSTASAVGSDEFLTRFTSNRTLLWEVGFKEVPNYWINGVGPRAFNEVYQTYPQEYQFMSYIWQPHLHGLEVLIETGVIGFIPYLFVLLYLFIRMFTAKAGNVWIMVGFVAMMPINSHMGLYEGYWMSLIWPPIMIGLAQAYRAERPETSRIDEDN